MITHKKMVDEVLEQQLVYLENYIRKNDLESRIERLVYGQRCKWRTREIKEKIKNPLKNKPLYQILEAVYNDEL